jgi:hypothetical protein
LQSETEQEPMARFTSLQETLVPATCTPVGNCTAPVSHRYKIVFEILASEDQRCASFAAQPAVCSSPLFLHTRRDQTPAGVYADLNAQFGRTCLLLVLPRMPTAPVP